MAVGEYLPPVVTRLSMDLGDFAAKVAEAKAMLKDLNGTADIKVGADRDQKTVGTAAMHVRVSAGDAEYFDAAMRAPLLKRIAEETGGRFFTPANAAS